MIKAWKHVLLESHNTTIWTWQLALYGLFKALHFLQCYWAKQADISLPFWTFPIKQNCKNEDFLFQFLQYTSSSGSILHFVEASCCKPPSRYFPHRYTQGVSSSSSIVPPLIAGCHLKETPECFWVLNNVFWLQVVSQLFCGVNQSFSFTLRLLVFGLFTLQWSVFHTD